jgi:nitrate reductase delta subunit
MESIHQRYDCLAKLLAYPQGDYRDKLDACRRNMADVVPEAASLLDQFAVGLAGRSVEEIEELYTQTFDLNPVCSLEVGWHLFGENYSRGEFLVVMRQELRRYGLPESSELPDHLTHVLRALGHMETPEADRFIRTYVLPALQKMLAALAEKDSPWTLLLEAIRCVLTSPYAAVPEEVVS